VWELLKYIATDKTWSGIAVAFLTAVGGWVWRQLSADDRAKLEGWERFARDAGAWAILHATSGMTVAQVQELGVNYLGKLYGKLGVPDAVRDHLAEVTAGFIAQELLARSKAPPVPVVMIPSPAPPAPPRAA
jgi:hypothetical protein